MKLKFDPNLKYQSDAIDSVTELFNGQNITNSTFTVAPYNRQLGIIDTTTGIANSLNLDKEEILKNLRQIQLGNGIKQTEKTEDLANLDFDIEMETGTGKTYVYLKTILELSKKYGFAKYIIIVPNIAIKEGVYKSLQITKEHFESLYKNIIYDFFIYDSQKLEQVRNFAVSDTPQIMVINIDAFRKSFEDPSKENKSNIIHRPNDKLNGQKPIDLIKETNPIIIIDEPQSVDTTPKSKKAIDSLNPLCIFRYSATHVQKHIPLYKLGAVESFNLGLVKQIEVASFESADNHNSAYMCLKSTDNTKSPITAKIEIDTEINSEVKRKTVTVKQGDDLYEKSNGREIYRNHIIDDIYCAEDLEYVQTSQGTLYKGKSVNDIDTLAVKDQQIKKTIQEHLDKELRLNPKGIKVLSLFFIDKVSNYYGTDGKRKTGTYAELFEKHYNDLITQPKYQKLAHRNIQADKVHDGYFARDKNKSAKDSKGNTKDDEDAYNLIMKDKEKLLSFDSDLRFIFSHSALREGWDNPNVFQICTLNETSSEIKKRQEIGRGLRLCVTQEGERCHDSEINTLTIMANESYEEFASKLQKEYETDEGIKFGFIELHTFANIPITNETGDTVPLGEKNSVTLYHFFEENNYINSLGKIQPQLKEDIKNDTVKLPEQFNPIKSTIIDVCKKSAGNLPIRPVETRKKVLLNKQVVLSEEFKELWEKIKYKTTYAVDFNSSELINKCIEKLKGLIITAPKLIYTKAEIDVTAGGVSSTERLRQDVSTDMVQEYLPKYNKEYTPVYLPDIVMYLQNRTGLTRKTIITLLTESKTLDKFKRNPQKYMEGASEIILSEMRRLLIDGIKYTRLGDGEYYALELMFQDDENTGYLESRLFSSKKSAYDYVICDSANEKSFAEKFENNNDIKLYAKLPQSFKIPTPLGSYNPDWAVLVDKNGMEKLYFVLETKGSISEEDLRVRESGKIECGKRHFAALNSEAEFKAVDNFNKFIEGV